MRRAVCTLLAALPLLSIGLVAYAQPAPRPRLPAEAEALLSTDTARWMAEVDALRANPRARDILLQALLSQPNSPRRWRLAYHLIEWGTPRDIGTLVDLLDSAEGPDRRALLGALTALYPRPVTPLDLTQVVTDFTFLPQSQPEAFAPEATGKYVVTDFAIQAYYQDNLPVRLVERVAALKGRTYDSRTGVADALQRQLQGKQWSDYGERLLAPLSPVPARLSESGTLQAHLTNPSQRPVVIELTFQCWFGRCDPQPIPHYVAMAPGETVLEQFPVRLIAPADPGQVRVFMRYRELNGGTQMEAQKLSAILKR